MGPTETVKYRMLELNRAMRGQALAEVRVVFVPLSGAGPSFEGFARLSEARIE